MESFRASLMKYHDELADLKSYFDGHISDETFEEQTLIQIWFLKWPVYNRKFCRIYMSRFCHVCPCSG